MIDNQPTRRSLGQFSLRSLLLLILLAGCYLVGWLHGRNSVQHPAQFAADFDKDGDLDVYVTDDTGSNGMYINQGRGIFVIRAK